MQSPKYNNLNYRLLHFGAKATTLQATWGQRTLMMYSKHTYYQHFVDILTRWARFSIFIMVFNILSLLTAVELHASC